MLPRQLSRGTPRTGEAKNQMSQAQSRWKSGTVVTKADEAGQAGNSRAGRAGNASTETADTASA